MSRVQLAAASALALQPALSARQPTPTGKIQLAALLASMESAGSAPPVLLVTALSVQMLLLVLNAQPAYLLILLLLEPAVHALLDAVPALI